MKLQILKKTITVSFVVCMFMFVSGCANTGELGHFEKIGPMNVPRYGATSVVLDSGQVLILGGSYMAQNADTKKKIPGELYMPESRTFTPLPPMNEKRSRFTANLLPNGTVLIAGGLKTSTTAVASTEIYNPETRAFNKGPDMLEPRAKHTAISLDNGDILFFSGDDGTKAIGNTKILKTVERYNFKRNIFESAGNISLSGSSQFGSYTRALLLENGKVLIGGGAADGGLTTALEVYDPETLVTKPIGSLKGRPPFSWIVLSDGKIANFLADPKEVEIYDPSTKISYMGGKYNKINGVYHSQLLENNKVLVSGSGHPVMHIQEVELYEPVKQSFSHLKSFYNAYGASSFVKLKDGSVLLPDALNEGDPNLYLYHL